MAEIENIYLIKLSRIYYYLAKDNKEKANRIIEINNKYKPVSEEINIHGEEEPITEELNDNTEDINIDLKIINYELIKSANDYNLLMQNTQNRIKNIEKEINKERERLEDINMLCGANREFEISEVLEDVDFKGDFSYLEGVFSSKVVSERKISFNVREVYGNGVEGNNHVYDFESQPGNFISESINSSLRSNINDNNLITYYDYERIIVDKSEKNIFPSANYDDTPVQCSIIINAAEDMNKIKIDSESRDIIIKSVETSGDGITFNKIKENNIEINNDKRKYTDNRYIYNSGIICFPSTKFLKIVFESKKDTNERIAFKMYDVSFNPVY